MGNYEVQVLSKSGQLDFDVVSIAVAIQILFRDRFVRP